MRVLVTGGGPAGMMAALAAAEAGADVTLLEKNEKLGKKLYITGKGRCNLTNDAEEAAFFDHILRNGRFLRSSFSQFGNRDIQDCLKKAGLALKSERGGRIFPQSDKASDVTKTLEKLLAANGVEVRLHCEVTGLLVRDGAVSGVRVRQDGKNGKISADRVIIATGGLSYPSTGSTGDGYTWAKETGHTLMPLLPALVPVNAAFEAPASKAGTPADLMGLTLKNVTLTAFADGKKRFSEQGELLFAHFGVTGPLILSCSSVIGEDLAAGKDVRLVTDLKPALSEEQLMQRLERDVQAAGSKALSTLMGAYLPKALIPFVLAQAGLNGTGKAAVLNKNGQKALVKALKGLPLKALSLRGYEEAIVTRGGVSVKDIEPKTMASKKIKNLYFAGEILDLDGTTGGFNLQIAWTTGRAAGRAAARKEESMKKTEKTNRNIAIDGPAGSGKSTIAKQIAKATGLIYVDTGAMYRAMAICFLRKGLAPDDEAGISAACEEISVSISYENGAQQVWLNGENVTPYLREEEVGKMASASSVYPAVREKMKGLQQQLGREKQVVMDGRDIGTVILPDAFLKIYMTASVAVRAKRRYDELIAKGEKADLDEVAREIEERDWRDMHREIAPLRQAEDAVLLDTSDMSIEEVRDAVLALYRREA